MDSDDAFLAELHAFTAGACDRGPLLLVAAHPDDESLGGSVLLDALGPWAHVLHTTDGAPRDGADARRAGHGTLAGYASARRAEAGAALSLVGVEPDRRHRLGCVDQELVYALPEAVRAVHELCLRVAPALVVTHAYEGGHPDHDATAFAVHTALDRLPPERRPLLIEMALYHQVGDELRRLQLLAGPGRELRHRLDGRQRQRKRAMLEAFVSQQEVLAPFLEPLCRPSAEAVESFRREPCPNFERPPHAGPLHYERQPWGLTGERWRRLARDAAASLRGGAWAASPGDGLAAW